MILGSSLQKINIMPPKPYCFPRVADVHGATQWMMGSPHVNLDRLFSGDEKGGPSWGKPTRWPPLLRQSCGPEF